MFILWIYANAIIIPTLIKNKHELWSNFLF